MLKCIICALSANTRIMQPEQLANTDLADVRADAQHEAGQHQARIPASEFATLKLMHAGKNPTAATAAQGENITTCIN